MINQNFDYYLKKSQLIKAFQELHDQIPEEPYHEGLFSWNLLGALFKGLGKAFSFFKSKLNQAQQAAAEKKAKELTAAEVDEVKNETDKIGSDPATVDEKVKQILEKLKGIKTNIDSAPATNLEENFAKIIAYGDVANALTNLKTKISGLKIDAGVKTQLVAEIDKFNNEVEAAANTAGGVGDDPNNIDRANMTPAALVKSFQGLLKTKVLSNNNIRQGLAQTILMLKQRRNSPADLMNFGRLLKTFTKVAAKQKLIKPQ